MRKRVLGVLLCASLMVGALPGVALATHKPVQERPFATILVVCPEFQTGHGTFTQFLPLAALHGARISLERSAGGTECYIDQLVGL